MHAFSTSPQLCSCSTPQGNRQTYTLIQAAMTAARIQDALIGGHKEIRELLLAHKGKVFRKAIGLVEYTEPEEAAG